MRIQTNTTDRKALVKAIAEELHTEYRYLRTPTYAYEVGDFTVDRDGNIIGEDFTPLMSFLRRSGFITEDALVAQTEHADESAEEDALVVEPADNSTEETNSSADSEAPTSMLSNIDEQTITIPAPGIPDDRRKVRPLRRHHPDSRGPRSVAEEHPAGHA